MNIGLFIDNFTKIQYYKDPGIITLALKDLNYNMEVYCFNADIFTINKLGPNIISKKMSENVEFWKKRNIKYLIIYSWLSIKYTGMIEAANKAGIKVILKLDSDGNLLYPDKPSYMKVFGLNNSLKAKMVHCIRLFQWYVIPKYISRIRIKQINLSHKLIIESPIAKDNLSITLNYWNQSHLIPKITVIENPIEWIKQESSKDNKILCIGRWNDKRKNAKALISVMNSLSTDWEVLIIGTAAKKVHSRIKNPNLSLNSIESLPHFELAKLMNSSKIIFVPSICESFCLVAAEGLCQGCSVVGSPIPSLIHLSSKNSGSIAKDFRPSSFLEALLIEISKWKDNYYNEKKITSEWRAVLDPKIIVKKISSLIR
ncbi:MAG: glycosyltransferase [Clostridia bacterium]|nr:glycosyltransferase [Clostridia bacterium]